MRKLPLLLIVAVVVALAPAAFGGALKKYKDWPNSPQGYFMTNAERAEWKADVKNDDDAEKFVNKFVASRGPGFADDVAKRADVADKRLTVSGRQGSRTLRGKVVILLGPPSAFAITPRELSASERSGSPNMAAGVSGATPLSGPGGGDRGASVADMIDAANSMGMSNATRVNDYVFTYSADKLPNKPAKDFVVTVTVNPGDGTDKIFDKKAAADLDAIFEQVAQKSLASAAAPAK